MGKHSNIKALTVQEQQDIQKVQQSVEDDFLQFRNVTGKWGYDRHPLFTCICRSKTTC